MLVSAADAGVCVAVDGLKWHAGKREDDKLSSEYGWRAQHFHGLLRYQQAYWGMTGMRVVTVDLSGP